jgi:ketopantoate reductase
MRIAVAGGGGLGYVLATTIAAADNAYNVIVLSRTVRSMPSSSPYYPVVVRS